MERAAGNPLFLRELASVGREDRRGRGSARDGRSARRDADRPARARRPRAPALGVGARRLLLGSVDRRGPRGRPERRGRVRGVGPTRRVRRTGSRRAGRVPLPPRTHPRRCVRRASRSSGGASSTDASPRSSSSDEQSDPRTRPKLLSLHYYRAERWPETWRYSVARRSAGRGEVRERRGCSSSSSGRSRSSSGSRTSDPDEVARVWEALGDARMRIGAFERAGAAFREPARTSPGDAVEEARLMQKEAMAPLRLGRYPQALRRLTQALRALDGRRGRRLPRPASATPRAGTRPSCSTSGAHAGDRVVRASDRGGERASGARGRPRAGLLHPRLGVRGARSAGRGGLLGSARSRSTRSSATSTVSRGCSTTSAARPTCAGAGTKHSSSRSVHGRRSCGSATRARRRSRR